MTLRRLPEQFATVREPILSYVASSLAQVRASIERNKLATTDIVCQIMVPSVDAAQLAILERASVAESLAKTSKSRSTPWSARTSFRMAAERMRVPAPDGYFHILVFAGSVFAHYLVARGPIVCKVSDLPESAQILLAQIMDGLADAFDSATRSDVAREEAIAIVDATTVDDVQGGIQMLVIARSEVRQFADTDGDDGLALAFQHAAKSALHFPPTDGCLRTILSTATGTYAVDVDVFTPRGDA